MVRSFLPRFVAPVLLILFAEGLFAQAGIGGGAKLFSLAPNPFTDQTEAQFGRELMTHDQVVVSFVHQPSGTVARTITTSPRSRVQVNTQGFPAGRYEVFVRDLSGNQLAVLTAACNERDQAQLAVQRHTEAVGDTKSFTGMGDVVSGDEKILGVSPNPFDRQVELQFGRPLRSHDQVTVNFIHLATNAVVRTLNTNPRNNARVSTETFPGGRYMIEVRDLSGNLLASSLSAREERGDAQMAEQRAAEAVGDTKSFTGMGDVVSGDEKILGVSPNPFDRQVELQFGRPLRSHDQVTVNFIHLATNAVVRTLNTNPRNNARVSTETFPGGRYMIEVRDLSGNLLASSLSAREERGDAQMAEQRAAEAVGDTKSLHDKRAFQVWPNPFEDRIFVNINPEMGRERLKLTLRSASTGQVVLTTTVSPRNSIVIQTSQVPNGVYILEVHDAFTNEHIGSVQLRK